MKLDDATVDYIFNVVQTADMVNIDNIIIEPGMVRSINEARTTGLFTNTNVPDMPFNSIGITRIHDLLSRYNIAKEVKDFGIEVSTNSEEEWAQQFVLKGKNLKIDYRCGDPRKLKSPKALNDIKCFGVQLSEQAVSLFQKGLSAMNSETVSLVSNNGVSFEFADVSNDIYQYTFADTVDLIPNEDGEVSSTTKFVHRYPAKTLLALFKSNPEAKFAIGQKGMLLFPINDLTVFVLPQV